MGAKSFLLSELENEHGQVKFAATDIQANYITCELSIQRVVTFELILYRKHDDPSVPFSILLNCRVVVLSMIKQLCLEIMFSNVIK